MDKNYYPIEFDAESSFTLTNGGTAPAPCCITIIPKFDFMILTIEGLSNEPIKVKNVKANQVVVIDGENRTITIDNIESFDKYDAWEFPKLQPGVNSIKIPNGGTCDVAIEYTRRYI